MQTRTCKRASVSTHLVYNDVGELLDDLKLTAASLISHGDGEVAEGGYGFRSEKRIEVERMPGTGYLK